MLKDILKSDATHYGLVFLGILVVAITMRLAPLIFDMLPNASYRFVLLFLLIIVASNVLAKLAVKYISL